MSANISSHLKVSSSRKCNAKGLCVVCLCPTLRPDKMLFACELPWRHRCVMNSGENSSGKSCDTADPFILNALQGFSMHRQSQQPGDCVSSAVVEEAHLVPQANTHFWWALECSVTFWGLGGSPPLKIIVHAPNPMLMVL